jgi:hypothetical protein
MLASSLCLQLALHLSACEHALGALDSQYQLFEPVRRIERMARIGLEQQFGTATVKGFTIFLGPALDWQLRSRIYLSIEGKF